MSNSNVSVSINVVDSVRASFSSIINNDREVKLSAIKMAEKQIETLMSQIETLQKEVATTNFTEEHESALHEAINMLPSSLSPNIRITTALQILGERFGKDLSVTFKEGGNSSKNASLPSIGGGNRESKDAFQERLLAAMSDGQEYSVKLLSESLDKAIPQVNTLLNTLSQLGKVTARKMDGSRTIMYKIVR